MKQLLKPFVFALSLLILSTAAFAQQDSAVVAKGLVRSMICLLFQVMPAIVAVALIAGGAMILLSGAERRNTGKNLIKNSLFAFITLVALMFVVSVALPEVEVASCFSGSILENQAPIAEARVGYVVGSLEKRVEITVWDAAYFDGSLSRDLDGSVAQYFWTFGDGGNASGETAQHNYTTVGEYTAELVVTDNAGLQSRIPSRVKVLVNPGLVVQKSVDLLDFVKPAPGSGLVVDYVVRDPMLNVSFVGNAIYGTPCPGPDYYGYAWYLNKTLIGDKKEFIRNSMDFVAGKYKLTLNATDCLGRTAENTTDLYIVEKLNASILNITIGGSEIYQTTCSALACNLTACNPDGTRNATDSYIGNKEYTYNRTFSTAGVLLYLTYDGSLIYDVTEPSIEVLFPSDCGDCDPHGFYTILRDNASGEYFVLIGEDDFIGGLPNVPPPMCKDVCNAFLDDFIPIVSEILICGANQIDGPTRVGTTAKGYTLVTAANSQERISFVFADDMAEFFKEKKWRYKNLETRSGTSLLTVSSLCFIANLTNHTTEKCPINFSAKVSGGLAPYRVKWVSSDDGVFDEHTIKNDSVVYDLITTPPMSPPISPGIHDMNFFAVDQLGLTSNSSYAGAEVPACCAIGTPCHTHWPGREGPLVNTGNEVSYGCDIYEVCRPEIWERAREAAYCCKTNCTGAEAGQRDAVCNKASDGVCDPDCRRNEDPDCTNPDCHASCKQAVNWSNNLRLPDGTLSSDGVKKCAALYLIEGFGPEQRFMTDYFWPEICAMGDSYCLNGCCPQDLGTCSCCWHAYNREALSLPVRPATVWFSSRGWRSDVAMNKNTCYFADLPAYASMEIINTGTCCDYSNALTTTLRIVGYNNSEVYSVTGPGHCFNLIKLPGETRWNLVDTTGNKRVPYVPTNRPPGGYPYCSYYRGSCRNDAGQVRCPNEPVWGC